MRKIIVYSVIIAFFVILSLSNCTSTAKPTARPNLDQAIKEAAVCLDEEIAVGTKIAVLNFTSPSDQLSAYVIDELTANFLETKKLTVVDRKEIDLIQKELNFQFSGDVSDDSMQELGKMLGAEVIISGSFMEIGSLYRVTIRALAVQTAVVAVQYRTDIRDDSRVQSLLSNGGKPQSAQSPSPKTPPQTSAARPAMGKVYEVGDIGPSSGIVFYDKGNNSGGWRYLEYASSNFKGKYWASAYTNIASTETGIGTGKNNTELIVKALNRRGDKDMAAQLCNGFTQGGYNDWFLPSKDELNLLYEYLYKNAMLGSQFGFYNWFYSSSQYDESNAWGQNFMDGSYQGPYIKNVSMGGGVQPIRAF